MTAARANAPDQPVRDAATVILVRDIESDPHILMGQRGSKAAFMPSKFVFPGGALDTAADFQARLCAPADPATLHRLATASDPALAEPLLLAAIRELWEETGLLMGRHDPEAARAARDSHHPDWHGFLDAGALPSGAGLTYMFRAITPPGRTRRFDARFFMADARHVLGDLDDFSHASDELSMLHWADLDAVRKLDLPFITEVVLAELQTLLESGGAPASIPFFHHEDGRSYFDRL
ncbi:DNA mismatch repair protein MutT [Maritimibacter sp. 55A14]|uniref:NUDIX hydrolase n=1 Tax=Maritimibacter sp. 55A14 TaxID=2174844 RepID=UPI000D60B647|nr:NUDIX domain-containing protein [Maritimibacter sp. 55A14]PWE33833.1 DNA mismatch repair protein MutT [Maritimibacter sp. 55A14]